MENSIIQEEDIKMPYIDDVNNEKKYIPSKYAKEELPTWNEIYNEFYKERVHFYNPADESHQVEDLYWKVPHRKILLGWICNQFNKMIFEDNAKSSILEWINTNLSNHFPIGVRDIHFVLFGNDITGVYEECPCSYINLPIIYTCEIPSTGKRSIFASDSPSKNIKEFPSSIQLAINLEYNNSTIQRIISDNMEDNIFWNVIRILIKDIIVYFEGDFVGWKDDNGKPLVGTESEIKPGCGYQSGMDAAI